MASPLQPLSISAPSFFGLNTQDSSIDLPPQFALQADNCVIDQFGRIGARKGLNQFTPVQEADPIRMLHEHIRKNADRDFYYASGADFYSVANDGVQTLEFTHPTSTVSNWQPVSFNGDFYAFQEEETPVIRDITGATGAAGWGLLGTKAGTTLPASVTYFGTGSAVYGRIWAGRTNLDKQTIYWSDTLIGFDFTTGAAGSISLENVFPNGTDEIVHIAGFNGFLIVFCRNCIIIYSGADGDPSTDLVLSDVIDGVGCIGRDTVQDIGTDLVFCSNQGVISLNRTIQEKSLPQRDLSKNIRDRFLIEALNEPNPIKTVFSPRDAFYLVALNSLNKVYCFDLRTQLPDGSARVTTWSGMDPTAFSVRRNQELLHIGESGYVNKYQNFADRGSAYDMSYLTNNIIAENQTILKILKKANVLLIGGSEDDVIFRYDTDYGTNYATRLKTLPATNTSEFNIAEFGIGEFSPGLVTHNLMFNISRTGRVFQFGLIIRVFGQSISVQQLEVFYKLGRLA